MLTCSVQGILSNEEVLHQGGVTVLNVTAQPGSGGARL